MSQSFIVLIIDGRTVSPTVVVEDGVGEALRSAAFCCKRSRTGASGWGCLNTFLRPLPLAIVTVVSIMQI